MIFLLQTFLLFRSAPLRKREAVLTKMLFSKSQRLFRLSKIQDKQPLAIHLVQVYREKPKPNKLNPLCTMLWQCGIFLMYQTHNTACVSKASIWIPDLMYNEHNIACVCSHNLNTGCLTNGTIWIAYKYDLRSNGDLNSALNYPLFE